MNNCSNCRYKDKDFTSKTCIGYLQRANLSSAVNYCLNWRKELWWQRLMPIEYERLQTLPDDYTKGESDSARYNMLGDGWTLKVIEHILSYM